MKPTPVPPAATAARTPANPAASASPPQPDRADNGRFAPGNKGGPGNPFARQVARLRQRLLNLLTDEAMDAVWLKLLEMSQQGNLQATKLMLAYGMGKPQQNKTDADRLDAHEWECHKESVNMLPEAATILKTPAPSLPLDMVRSGRPVATEEMRAVAAQMCAVGQDSGPAGAATTETQLDKLERHEQAAAAEAQRLMTRPVKVPAPAEFNDKLPLHPSLDDKRSKRSRRRTSDDPPSPNGVSSDVQPSANGLSRDDPPSANGFSNSPPSPNGENDPRGGWNFNA